jgi:hypothetical protein|tara:strand:- start:275 stop:667 length:393 start_codon:yes stop_codon:yes gene_type:complete
MDKILNWFGGSVVKDILSGLDNLFTSKEEKIKAENVITKILVQKQLELQKMQTEIIIAEAKGNWLQRSWRPILMLSFGFIVIYVKFVAPLFSLPIPELENEFWNLLQLGIGGYVIGRTGEKMMDSFSKRK